MRNENKCKFCATPIYYYTNLKDGTEIGIPNGVKLKDGTYLCTQCNFDYAAKKADEIKKETGRQICLTCYAENGNVHFLD